MEARRFPETTQPASSTGDDSVSRAPLGLRWVFPMPATLATRSDRKKVLLGRGDDCDVVLRGMLASRHHAELVHEDRFWVIRDLGSRNGVRVNGRRVERVALSPGDVVCLGDWVGVVRRIADAAGDDESGFRQLAPGVWGGPLLAGILARVPGLAPTNLRFIIQGETGTGKECLARAIHNWSGRRGKFIGVNCAALPPDLAESELFGCARGAFTGADRSRLGHLRTAHGGTLLLDEITDLPLKVQPKLLRALEERAVTPLGESEPVRIDTLVIAATQESLQTAVDEKRFRADLCARLAGFTVVLPPLRDRSEDVPSLFARMLTESSERPPPPVHVRLVERLCSYDWPFNVREIQQLASQLAALHGHEPILKYSHLPANMRTEGAPKTSLADSPLSPTPPLSEVGGSAGNPAPWPADDRELLREQKREALRQALRSHGGNVSAAARALDISRQKAYRLMEGPFKAEFDELRGCSDQHSQVDHEQREPQ